MNDDSDETRRGDERGDDRADDRADESPERIPFMQGVLDNPFLLLFIGITIPTVLYLLWGVMEIASIPLAE